MPIYVICDYSIHKTDLADLFSFKLSAIIEISLQGISNLRKPNSLCFGKFSKFPVFSLTWNLFCHFPCFPCAVGTLYNTHVWSLKPGTEGAAHLGLLVVGQEEARLEVHAVVLAPHPGRRPAVGALVGHHV